MKLKFIALTAALILTGCSGNYYSWEQAKADAQARQYSGIQALPGGTLAYFSKNQIQDDSQRKADRLMKEYNDRRDAMVKADQELQAEKEVNLETEYYKGCALRLSAHIAALEMEYNKAVISGDTNRAFKLVNRQNELKLDAENIIQRCVAKAKSM